MSSLLLLSDNEKESYTKVIKSMAKSGLKSIIYAKRYLISEEID